MLKPKGTMLELTDNAIKRLTYIANKAGTSYVRLDIKGGGCAGYEYKWSTTNEREDTDSLLAKILVVSLELELYLLGTTLDWVEGEFNSEFKITNPNSKSSCGCGESFSV